MIALMIYVAGIILAGIAHWMRDTYSFQVGNTLWRRLYSRLPWWLQKQIGSYDGWRDYWHRMDSLMRFGCAVIGAAAMCMPVPWYVVPVLFFVGLWASEWLFGIMYHVVGVPSGHVDKKTLWQQIKSMMMMRP